MVDVRQKSEVRSSVVTVQTRSPLYYNYCTLNHAFTAKNLQKYIYDYDTKCRYFFYFNF